jgi:hypothetical protein
MCSVGRSVVVIHWLCMHTGASRGWRVGMCLSSWASTCRLSSPVGTMACGGPSSWRTRHVRAI